MPPGTRAYQRSALPADRPRHHQGRRQALVVQQQRGQDCQNHADKQAQWNQHQTLQTQIQFCGLMHFLKTGVAHHQINPLGGQQQPRGELDPCTTELEIR